MWLYSTMLICTISAPFFLSFDKKLQFYKLWKFILPSILVVAFFYIIFDIYLTKLGIWGFNQRYHFNILIFNLPLEECLFFIAIPYSSIFLHFSIVLYFPKLQLSNKVSNILSVLLIFVLAIVILLYFNKIYTIYVFSILIVALIISIFDKSRTINSYYVSFLFILVPFFVVNAILTGCFIDEEIVWYNNAQNLGIRIFTIPIEDVGYAFGLILLNLLLINKLRNHVDKKFS
jgi:lycopene cyclase domain-containing protein